MSTPSVYIDHQGKVTVTFVAHEGKQSMERSEVLGHLMLPESPENYQLQNAVTELLLKAVEVGKQEKAREIRAALSS